MRQIPRINVARTFYTGLFGWQVRETLKYGGPPYTIFHDGNESSAGAVQFGPDWGVTPRWSAFFSVPDYEACVRQAKALGGRLTFWRDVPETGRLGVLSDPQGAVFVIMRPDK